MSDQVKSKTSGQNLNKSTDNAQVVTDVNTNSFGNKVLWFTGITCFIAATLVNQFLPAYWQLANNIWVRIAAIVGLVVVGIILLLMTKQGKGFSKLLKDVQVELRRVTWPSKAETIEYTWKVLLAIFISGVLIYILDGLSSIFVNPFIN